MQAKILRSQLAEARHEAEAAKLVGQATSKDLERAREEAEEVRAYFESEAAELQKQSNALRDELAERTNEWAQQVH